MKTFIVKTSSILVEEFTIEANSDDEARDKWCSGEYLDVTQTEQMSSQIEDTWEVS
tara:strand:+ start:3492 stop:3659 length:168 start_codon:yes stop_codon:yes gene_type:complete